MYTEAENGSFSGVLCRQVIKIRNYNSQKIIIKNRISEKLRCNVVEIKKDHLSE